MLSKFAQRSGDGESLLALVLAAAVSGDGVERSDRAQAAQTGLCRRRHPESPSTNLLVGHVEIRSPTR
jgi:hypothetical protein